MLAHAHRLVALFLLVLGYGLTTPGTGRAEVPCFDLSQAVTSTLDEPVSEQGPDDRGKSGEKKDGRTWARLRGRVRRPIEQILAFLQDHRRFRDPRVDELEVQRLPPGPHLARTRVHSVVRPFPFVRVEWTDDWAYTLIEGTRESPQRVVVSYQKIEGTSHIAHSCGNLVLSRIDAANTEVYQYGEAKITGRSAEDHARSFAVFLERLRKGG